MIGHIAGTVLFSDGREVIVTTGSGIGYQIFYDKILVEGDDVTLYISHIYKEAGEELYGFMDLRSKKFFELLISVKGVGPKSANALLSTLGFKQICDAILFENNKVLSSAPGIGPKAAAQIILDLRDKIHKIKMFSEKYKFTDDIKKTNSKIDKFVLKNESRKSDLTISNDNLHQIIDETLMACKELGFKEDKIMPLAQQILKEHNVIKAEQLIHLVLRKI